LKHPKTEKNRGKKRNKDLFLERGIKRMTLFGLIMRSLASHYIRVYQEGGYTREFYNLF